MRKYYLLLALLIKSNLGGEDRYGRDVVISKILVRGLPSRALRQQKI